VGGTAGEDKVLMAWDAYHQRIISNSFEKKGRKKERVKRKRAGEAGDCGKASLSLDSKRGKKKKKGETEAQTGA